MKSVEYLLPRIFCDHDNNIPDVLLPNPPKTARCSLNFSLTHPPPPMGEGDSDELQFCDAKYHGANQPTTGEKSRHLLVP